MLKAISLFFAISFLMALGYGVNVILEKLPYYSEVMRNILLCLYYFVAGGLVFGIAKKVKE